MFTHVSGKGVGMVDISNKERTKRAAVAEGSIRLGPKTLSLIESDGIRKGNVLATAQLAGIMSAKRTSELIPLCHQIPLDSIDLDLKIQKDGILATCRVVTTYGTGVEMEALMGVSQALLTIWDMVKAVEKDEDGQYPSTRIDDIRVISKEK
ncbi:MAG TPA: cyclic pyranopterin monophosphate synthase MoaC [Candidatus Methanofastidiosa archaeon]|nr:cyclic pyranopterin monophosphate synthase MoaC [Candidatus Methanofastidiosa archaeon]HPR41433.1 cyclic pyranopterin monophosphate synthase MoaC [Candidatus Methanofastidiosa archaeon]